MIKVNVKTNRILPSRKIIPDRLSARNKRNTMHLDPEFEMLSPSYLQRKAQVRT